MHALFFSVYGCAMISLSVTFTGICLSFQRAHSMWKKRFGEEVKDELIYVVAMERVLQMEDFVEV